VIGCSRVQSFGLGSEEGWIRGVLDQKSVFDQKRWIGSVSPEGLDQKFTEESVKRER
jgi:hypothetical protein